MAAAFIHRECGACDRDCIVRAAGAVLVATLCSAVSADQPPDAAGRPAVNHVKLTGKSSGGTLIISEGLNPNPDWVELETMEGESAEVILHKLAERVRLMYQEKGFGIEFEAVGEGVLRTNLLLPFLFHGTESGLGIPAQPLGLTGFFDSEKGEYILKWIIQSGVGSPYDEIKVTGLGLAGPEIRTYPSSTESMTWPAVKGHLYFPDYFPGESEGYFVVWGVSDGVPSPAGAVLVSGTRTIDKLGHPHIDGVMPNWFVWALDGEDFPDATQVDAIHPRPKFNHGRPFLSPEEKPFHQRIVPQTALPNGIARPLPGYFSGDYLECSGLLRLPRSLRARTGWSIEMRIALVEDLPGIMTSRSRGHLSNEIVEKSTVLGVIDSENCPEYGQWFTFGPAKGEVMTFPYAVTDDSRTPVFLITFVGTDGVAIEFDWFDVIRMR